MRELIERSSGMGDLIWNGQVLRQVRYEITVYQQTLGPGGLPVPGLRRLEGSIDFDADRDPMELIGADLALELDDGRQVGIRLTGTDGAITACGHGVYGCSCC